MSFNSLIYLNDPQQSIEEFGGVYIGSIISDFDGLPYALFVDASEDKEALCIWGRNQAVNYNYHADGYRNTLLEHDRFDLEEDFEHNFAFTILRNQFQGHRGFYDWYIPSINELQLLYNYYKRFTALTLVEGDYWSSTLAHDGWAYFLNFETGLKSTFETKASAYCRFFRREQILDR